MSEPATTSNKVPGLEFFPWLGLYQVHWSSFELTLDIALWRLSDMPAEDAVRNFHHLIASEKIKNVRRLLAESSHPNKDAVEAILARLPEESARNSLNHSIMRFGRGSLELARIDRGRKVQYRSFTLDEFKTHLQSVADQASELAGLLGITAADGEAIWTAITKS